MNRNRVGWELQFATVVLGVSLGVSVWLVVSRNVSMVSYWIIGLNLVFVWLVDKAYQAYNRKRGVKQYLNILSSVHEIFGVSNYDNKHYIRCLAYLTTAVIMSLIFATFELALDGPVIYERFLAGCGLSISLNYIYEYLKHEFSRSIVS